MRAWLVALLLLASAVRAQEPVPVDTPARETPVQQPPVVEPPVQDPPVQDPPAVDPPAQDPPPAPPSDGNPTPAAPSIDYTKRCEEAAFDAEVGRLVAAHPRRVVRTTLGKSRGGRDLVVLAITDPASGPLERKPAVLLVTGLDPAFESRPAGPEAALYAARALLERAAADPALGAWLATSGAYVIPAPDPDQTFAPQALEPRACRLDRNFPSLWRPWSSETCAQGPYPLSEPETQALARFLQQRTNIGGVMLLSRGKDLATRVSGLEASESERILFDRIATEAAAGGSEPKTAAEALVSRALDFASESGSLAAFCRARMAAFVWPVDPFGSAVVETPLGPAPSDFARLAPGLAAVAAELPRVACTVTKTERLRERLWKVDLAVENQGLLPTLPAAERARSQGSLWLEAAGGRIAQVGIAKSGAAEVNAKPRPPAAWMLGHLDGREKVAAYLVVEAAEGTNLELTLGTLRAGSSRCTTILH